MEIQCSKCGSKAPAGAKFCPECGTGLASPVSPSFAPTGQNPDALVRMLCYLGGIVTGVIFLNLDPYRRNREIRFHAWQSIFFSLTWMGIVFIKASLPFFFVPFFPVAFLVQIGLVVLWVLLLVKAYNGDKFRLPVLGDFADKKADEFTPS